MESCIKPSEVRKLIKANNKTNDDTNNNTNNDTKIKKRRRPKYYIPIRYRERYRNRYDFTPRPPESRKVPIVKISKVEKE